MTATVTYSYSSDSRYSDYGSSEITLYATKPGKYTVSFTVVDATGKAIAKKKVTVQVVNSNYVVKKATFGKQTVESHTITYKNGTKKEIDKSNTKVSGSSGKFKVTSDSQYKITGLIVGYVDKNGKQVYKKIKNGGTVTLSKTYDHLSRYTTSSSRSDKKRTYIWVSYKDTFTGNTYKYSIVKNRGRKEVKLVSKTKLTGKTSVVYSPVSTISLWQY